MSRPSTAERRWLQRQAQALPLFNGRPLDDYGRGFKSGDVPPALQEPEVLELAPCPLGDAPTAGLLGRFSVDGPKGEEKWEIRV